MDHGSNKAGVSLLHGAELTPRESDTFFHENLSSSHDRGAKKSRSPLVPLCYGTAVRCQDSPEPSRRKSCLETRVSAPRLLAPDTPIASPACPLAPATAFARWDKSLRSGGKTIQRQIFGGYFSRSRSHICRHTHKSDPGRV